MDLTPIIQYRQLSNIEIDTDNMKLGNKFSIVFELHPYIRPFEKDSVQYQDTGGLSYPENKHKYIINYDNLVSPDDQKPRIESDMYNIDQYSNEKFDFQPIFTYNKQMLYDHHHVDTCTFFYNTHACYIYKQMLHWCINDMSDDPIMHLTINLMQLMPGKHNPIRCILSRQNKQFFLEATNMTTTGYNTPKIYNQYSTTTVNNDINLNVYDSGKLYLGYAERIPNHQYSSYTFKNTLAGSLGYFKIYKDRTLHWSNKAVYGDGESGITEKGIQKFENITKNSKYMLNDITYHNKDNNKVRVNQLQDKRKKEEYLPYRINELTVMYNEAFSSTNSDRKISTDIKTMGYAQVYNTDTVTKTYPIIYLDVEEKIDENNVNFYQDMYILKGTYNNTSATFTHEKINKDTNITSIANVLSIYDIFIGYIIGKINNLDDSPYSQNYIQCVNIINNLMSSYASNNKIIKNIQIISHDNQEYIFKYNLHFILKQKIIGNNSLEMYGSDDVKQYLSKCTIDESGDIIEKDNKMSITLSNTCDEINIIFNPTIASNILSNFIVLEYNSTYRDTATQINLVVYETKCRELYTRTTLAGLNHINFKQI